MGLFVAPSYSCTHAHQCTGGCGTVCRVGVFGCALFRVPRVLPLMDVNTEEPRLDDLAKDSSAGSRLVNGTDGTLSPVEFESGDELITANSQDVHGSSTFITPFKRVMARFSLFKRFMPCCKCRGQYRVPTTEPKDHFHLVYICMLMAGAGFLFPWSSYISAIDYFFFLYHSQFSTVSEAIPVTYLLTTLFASTINVGLVGLFSIHSRIRFGYLTFFISLIFVPLLDIGINNCTVSTSVSYYLTLFSVVGVGIGSGGMYWLVLHNHFLHRHMASTVSVRVYPLPTPYTCTSSLKMSY